MADKNYLDSDGVLYLWQKIKAKITDAIKNKVDKVDGKGLSTNDYTTAEKTKLAGIATNANNYSPPTSSGNKHIPSGGRCTVEYFASKGDLYQAAVAQGKS